MENLNAKTSVESCQAKHPVSGIAICDRAIWDAESNLCIFHCKQKPIDKFTEHFLSELNELNRQKGAGNFNGRRFVFPQGIKLEMIHFSKAASFEDAYFGDNFSFEYWEFDEIARFNRAQFGSKVNFSDARFKKVVVFTGTEFGEKVYFGKAVFEGEAHFNGAKFNDNASFFKANFKDIVSFERAEFGNNSFWAETHFEKGGYFFKTQFQDKTSFASAKFSSIAYFSEARFGNQSSFEATAFQSEAYFIKTEFGDQTNLKGTRFKKRASFSDTRFGHNTEFHESQFSDQTYFENTHFETESNFKYVDFESKLHFTNVTSNGQIKFTDVNLRYPQNVLFSRLNLGSILLARTNVQEVSFMECDWPKLQKRCAIQDEIQLREGKENAASPEEIEQLYRRLQTNFENNRRYGEAGDFYIGVMEMRRKQLAEKTKRKSLRWLRQNVFSLIAWYRHVSLYGERYARCLYWILGMILLFPALYLLAGFEDIKYVISHQYDARFFIDYFKALNISFHAMTFQREESFQLTVWSQICYIVESILSATLVALFLLAVRRRFRR